MQSKSGVYWSDKIPTDSEGYTVSFDINEFDAEKVKDFFQKYGLVIFNNIIDSKEIELSIDDIWKEV